MSHIPIGLIAGSILVPLLFTCIWVAYITYKYTEKAEAFLSQSKIVEGTKSNYSQAGFLGKIMRNAMLTMALMIPEPCIKRGVLDRNEVIDFPKNLKQLLFAAWGSVFIISAALIAFGIYAKIVAP